MTSSRLPGKVLSRVRGKPLLQYLLERLGHCTRLGEVIVATSAEESDAPVARLCRELDVPAFRGPLEDVAGRFLSVLDAFPLDGFVRLSADSPLLDQRLVDEGVRIFGEGGYDLVTNVFPRTFPSGESVEVVRSGTFRRAYPSFDAGEDREHVTRYFYRRSREFAIRNFASDVPLGDVHLAVDTEEDLERFRAMVGRMTRPHWEYPLGELIKIYEGLH